MKKFKKLKGFTLIELVTAIAVIVVLTVISTPIYNSYASKAKQTEGYLLLATIRSAQGNYFTEYANYLKSIESTAGNTNDGYVYKDDILGINVRGNDYYTWFNINDGSIDCKIGYQAMVKSKFGDLVLIFNRTTGATVK